MDIYTDLPCTEQPIQLFHERDVLRLQSLQALHILIIFLKPGFMCEDVTRDQEQQSLREQLLQRISPDLHHQHIEGYRPSRGLDQDPHLIWGRAVAPQEQDRRMGDRHPERGPRKAPLVQPDLCSVLKDPDQHAAVRGALAL